MLTDVINTIKEDIYNLPSKDKTLKVTISEKIENANEIYLRNIERNFNYLLTRNNLRLIKTLKREALRKEQEKQAREEGLIDDDMPIEINEEEDYD